MFPKCKCKFKDNIELVYLVFFFFVECFTWFGNRAKWGLGR